MYIHASVCCVVCVCACVRVLSVYERIPQVRDQTESLVETHSQHASPDPNELPPGKDPEIQAWSNY